MVQNAWDRRWNTNNRSVSFLIIQGIYQPEMPKTDGFQLFKFFFWSKKIIFVLKTFEWQENLTQKTPKVEPAAESCPMATLYLPLQMGSVTRGQRVDSGSMNKYRFQLTREPHWNHAALLSEGQTETTQCLRWVEFILTVLHHLDRVRHFDRC